MLDKGNKKRLNEALPKKPVERGFKISMRGDSINGYISEFEVYIGKQGDKVEVGLGRKVVETLTVKLKEKHYHIYIHLTIFSHQLIFSSYLLEGVVFICVRH